MGLYRHYLYRWIDVYDEVMYVGETRRMIDKRIAEHMSCNPRRTNFTKRDLPLIHKVEYIKFDNAYDALDHERYYISLWKPRLNKAGKYTGVRFDKNKRSDWKTLKFYKPLINKKVVTSKKLSAFENFVFIAITIIAFALVGYFYFK